MLGEHMKDEELGKICRGGCIVSRNKDCLFGELINNDQDCHMSGRAQELLYEIHGDGVPGFLWDQKLLQCSIGSVPWRFSSVTICAGLTEILYKVSEARPNILTSDQHDGLVLTEMSSSQMVVLVSEYTEMEVVSVWYVDLTILPLEFKDQWGQICQS